MAYVFGIDLAWQSADNSSAVAIATCSPDFSRIETIHPEINNWNNILKLVHKQDLLVGISIDAPLIVNNKSGQRRCENELSQKYGSRKASCHSTNLTMYPNPDGVSLSKELNLLGFEHLNLNGKFQIECYPHPAIIEVFGLKERLRYKKGTISEKKEGQMKLANYIK